LTAWPTRIIRSVIDIEQLNNTGGMFGSSNAETQKTLSLWAIEENRFIKVWTSFYIIYRMSMPKELRGDKNWTGDKELEKKLVVWGRANLQLLRDSQGLIAEVNI
jgi:hypothetical protein